MYDEHNKLCCGSHLEDKIDPISGFERTCCKGQNETQFPGKVVVEGKTCCGGNLYDESKDGHMGCCGAARYDRNEHICCRNYETDEVDLHEGPEDKECCGLAAYNYTTHWCYEEVSPPRVTSWNILYHRGYAYDINKQIPCDDAEGTILDLPEQDPFYPINYKCCNKELIDADMFKCCPANADRNSVEHPIRQTHTCCGNSSVKTSNPRQEQCCNGVPNKISKEAAEENHRCCGSDFISVKYGCCNGQKLEPECACCGGNEAYSMNSPIGCCGGHLYDTNDEVCCPRSSSKSKPIKKKERDHTDCCIKTQKSYNRFNQSQAEQCVTGGRALKPCPYCDSSLSSTFCEKKSVYLIYVTDIEYRSKRTVITGYSSLKLNLTVSFPYRCVSCIQKDAKYAIFTNRRPKNERLRLNGRDMIIKYDKENISEIHNSCKILEKINRTIKKSQKKGKGVRRRHKKHQKSRRRHSRRSQRRLA